MVDERREALDALVATVGTAAGALPAEVRRTLLAGGRVDGGLGRLAALVAAGGLAVTDEDVRALLAAGHSQDEVFECVVAAAVGAGLARLRAVERLLGSGR